VGAGVLGAVVLGSGFEEGAGALGLPDEAFGAGVRVAVGAGEDAAGCATVTGSLVSVSAGAPARVPVMRTAIRAPTSAIVGVRVLCTAPAMGTPFRSHW
jgi:hypothetical protein